MSTGRELIEAERRRQVDEEGYGVEHDRGRAPQLARAGGCYRWRGDFVKAVGMWPWAPKYWKPKNRRSNLIRAGALYLAAADAEKDRVFRSIYQSAVEDIAGELDTMAAWESDTRTQPSPSPQNECSMPSSEASTSPRSTGQTPETGSSQSNAADPVASEGLLEGALVRMRHRSPNHAAGQLGTLCHASPSGHTVPGLYWIDYGEPIQWSFGQSESTGEWCGPSEFEYDVAE